MIADIGLVASYGEALHAAAVKAGVEDVINQQAGILAGLVQSEPRLRALMEAPNIARETKESVFVKVFGSTFDKLLVNFVRLLIRRGRLELFVATLDEYRELYRAARGIASGTLITAVELSADEKARVEKQLSSYMNKKLEITWRVDPSVIGGVRFLSGDILIDSTLSRGLERLKQSLRRARVF